ncbi:MAG: hypothetical protein ACI9UJ_001352 [bacterium]|jgi:hypothetical protein
MKDNFIYLLLVSLSWFFYGCEKPSGPPEPVVSDMFDVYKYYPLDSGNKWIYELEIIDVNGQKSFIEERALYSKDSQTVNFYREGKPTTFDWGRHGSRFICCRDQVLLNFNLIGCSEDSIQIYRNHIPSPSIFIHQFCKDTFATDVPNYDKIKSIRTFQTYTFEDGITRHLITYFGYGVGLTYRQTMTYDELGVITNQETLRLKSHYF